MPFEAKFPAGSAYAGWKIDTNDARYREQHALAEAAGLSQEQFSKGLEFEAQRVDRQRIAAENARAAPPAAPPVAKPDFSKMTTAQQFHHALTNGPKRG